MTYYHYCASFKNPARDITDWLDIIISVIWRNVVKLMTKELKIPEELRGAYNNLIRRISFEYCDDPHLEETILVYLKLGGKKLADHKLESLNKPFNKDFILRKMQLRNEILSEESSSNENQIPVTDTPELDSPDSDSDANDVNNVAD